MVKQKNYDKSHIYLRAFSGIIIVFYLSLTIYFLCFGNISNIYPLSLAVSLSLVFANLERFEVFKFPFIHAKLKVTIQEAYTTKAELELLRGELEAELTNLDKKIEEAKTIAIIGL